MVIWEKKGTLSGRKEKIKFNKTARKLVQNVLVYSQQEKEDQKNQNTIQINF